MTVDVILPALDEGSALPTLLAALPAGYRAIVVDNGSTDRTRGRGRGRAPVGASPRGFRLGLSAPASSCPRPAWCCSMDADGSFDPRELPKVALRPVWGGVRPRAGGPPGGPGRVAGHARAPACWPSSCRRRLAFPLHDPGRVLPAGTISWPSASKIAGRGGRSRWSCCAARAGWRIDETTVAYAPPAEALGGHRAPVRGTARAVADMDRVLRRHTSG